MTPDEILASDRNTLWHPYSNSHANNPLYVVESANNCTLHLGDGRQLIDGMSSWWSTIHGYNHPALNKAVTEQLAKMAHVMFGGLTHEPAVKLAKRLIELTPKGLDRVFFADSGSVSVEVALKMATQYWIAKNQPEKKQFIAFENAYHGDTFGAMSVCDPHNGMHTLFSGGSLKNQFCPPPSPVFGNDCSSNDTEFLTHLLKTKGPTIAAVIIEPIVQGAGGMRFYSADFLRQVRTLCNEHDVLLIADEIATGFGRTGKMFACEHAGISPDIMCAGKALTGGYMTLAATLCGETIAETISNSPQGALMHGPTFMGNPLACAVANESLNLLTSTDWQFQINRIEQLLKKNLLPLQSLAGVKDTRVLGAIGVIELENAVNMKKIQPFIVEQGVWLRPFGKLLYTMPPYCISDQELTKISIAMKNACIFHSENQ